MKRTLSKYAKRFNEDSFLWTKEAKFNLYLLKSQENLANQKLKAKGYLFLNEVYEMLGMPKTRAGQFVGWVYGSDGDNFVDFGIKPRKRNCNPIFILDFNVDGEILHILKEF